MQVQSLTEHVWIAAIGNLAQTALPAASAIAAGNDFFNSNPPQRVAGPPFDSAMALVNGTSADTVMWYTGEAGSTPARSTALAQVGPSTTIAYGVRANEPGRAAKQRGRPTNRWGLLHSREGARRVLANGHPSAA